MVARVTVAEIDPVRQDPRQAVSQFEDALVPALHEQEGYEGCDVLLSDEEKVLVVTFWSSEEAARAFQEKEKGSISPGKLADFVVYRSDPGREAYDVVASDHPVPAG